MFSPGQIVKVMRRHPGGDAVLYRAWVVRVTKTRVVVIDPRNKKLASFLISTGYEVGSKPTRGIGCSFCPRIVEYETIVIKPKFEKLHPRHLCSICGKHLDAHGGWDNPHRPYACPGAVWPVIRDNSPDSLPNWGVAVAAYWNERTTTFKPKV